jgi:hypothetical protein
VEESSFPPVSSAYTRLHQDRIQKAFLISDLCEEGGADMTKKATIKILLVEECAERADEEVKNDILEELSKNIHVIPWAAKIENVKITRV